MSNKVPEPKFENHESYGMLSFARFTGGDGTFFGSAIKHHAGVALEISRASVHHDLGQDHYFENQPLIRVEMSESQFAQLLSSMNSGGVPCTVRRVFKDNIAKFSKDGVDPCPERNVRKILGHEFKEKMREMAKDLQEFVTAAQALQEKSHIGKGDREEFTKIATGLQHRVSEALPFYQQQFTEAMEDISQDARANFESFVQQTLKSFGVEALKEKLTTTGVTLELGPGEAPTTTTTTNEPEH